MNRIALVRCWNEEATIIACLMSIENVFTHIVIIHSDITDSSLELIEAYSKGRSNIIIEKYPYHVYPALDDIYGTGSYDTKNSLAAYYNFGLNICQRIGGAICKIDCDQVYIEASLSAQFESLENSQVSTNQSYGAG